MAELKDGKKTTELWLTILLVVLGAAGQVFGALEGAGVDGHWVNIASMVTGTLLQVLAGLGYGAGRVKLKKAQLDGLSLVEASHAKNGNGKPPRTNGPRTIELEVDVDESGEPIATRSKSKE